MSRWWLEMSTVTTLKLTKAAVAPDLYSLHSHSLHYTKKKKRVGNKDCVFVWLAGWLAAMTLTQRSAEIKGTEEGQRRGEKVWFHMQVAVKDVYPKRPISPLSPKLELNKSSAQCDRQSHIKWRPWLSKQTPCYYVYLCHHMGFHSCFHWGWEDCSASQTRMKYF